MPVHAQNRLNNEFRRYYQKLTPDLKKPKNKATTTAVFSFLAISLFALYAIRPTAQTIIFLQREIKDKTVLNQQMENKITALIEAQSVYENIKNRLPVVTQALPENPDAATLGRQLRNLANISGASISAMQISNLPLVAKEATPGAKLADKPLEVFPINIVIEGPYAALKSFIDGILITRRIITIDLISFTTSLGLGIPGDSLRLALRLQSYYSSQ